MALADIRLLASKFFAAASTARSNLDNDFKVALFGAEGRESGAWGLSLVLGVWRRQKAGDSPAELAETGVAPLVAQIQKFEGAFPGSFSKFLATAEAAEDLGKIAAAGSYFSSTVNGLGMLVRPGLLAWLNSDNFKKVAKALVDLVGGPTSALVERPPSPPIKPTRPSFDRQDFQTTAAPPPPSPKPILALPENTQRDLDLARLIRSGWSPDEAARILEGPAALKRATEREGGAVPVVDGKEILKRSKTVDEPARKDDNGGIPGAVKSGLDLLREVLKQVNSGSSKGSGGKGAGGDGGSTNDRGNDGRGTMSGSGSEDDEDSGGGGTMEGGDGTETDDSPPDTEGGEGGDIVINDSADVDD